MTDPRSDAEIIKAAGKNLSEFAVIFRRHYRRVYRFTAGAAGDTQGEDLAADVFIRAMGALDRYDEKYETALPWLLGIASNLVLVHYRSLGRQKQALARLERRDQHRWDDTEEDTLDRVWAELERPLIARAIRDLPSGQSSVLLLRALGDMSYREIAEVLGINVGTVRSRLNRARETMRESLSALDTGEADG